MSFDTLAYVDERTKSGVDRKQAEAQARALKQIVMDDQATRQDLARRGMLPRCNVHAKNVN